MSVWKQFVRAFVFWILLCSLGSIRILRIEFQLLVDQLNPIAEYEFEGWRLSDPFPCNTNKKEGNLECPHVLFPSNTRGVAKYNDVGGYDIPNNGEFSFPLEYIAMCDNGPGNLCSDRFSFLEKLCVAWTALDNLGVTGKGEIYLIVDCWGNKVLFSMDHNLGHSIPLGMST